MVVVYVLFCLFRLNILKKDPMKPQRTSPGLIIKTRFGGKVNNCFRSWEIIEEKKLLC